MANRYWVGGTGTWDTTSTTNWSASSGGASGASVPTISDSVFFDQAGTYTVTMTGALTCLSFTVSAGTVTFADGTTPTLRVNGNMTLVSATVWNSTGTITFDGSFTFPTVTTNGVVINASILIRGSDATFTLGSALTLGATRTVDISDSTSSLNLSTFTLTTGSFSIGSSVGTLKFGTGNITLVGAGGTLFSNSATFITVTGSRTINVSNNSAAATIITTGTLGETSVFNFNFTTGTYALTMTAGNWGSLNFTGFAGTVNSSSHVIYGSINLGTTAAFTAGSATWNFSSTTAGRTITSNGRTFPNSVKFAGTGGSWVLQDAMTVPVARTTRLEEGTLNLNNFTLTTGFFLSDVSAARTIAFGTGNITVNGGGGTLWSTSISTGLTTTGTKTVNVSYSGAVVATTVSSGSLSEANSISFNFTTGTYSLTLTAGTKRNLNFTGFAGTVSNTAQTIYGDLNLGSTATFTSGATAWIFAATSTGKTITSNGKTMTFPATFNGVGGTWVLQDALTMGSTRLLTHTNGTIDLNGKTLTVGSSYTTATGTKNLTFNGGTLVCPANTPAAFNNAVPTGFTTTAGTGTGTISMTGATAKTFVGGGSTFNCTINQGGAGTLTISGGNTFNNITNTVQPATIRFPGAVTTTFNNFNLKGTAGNLISIENAGPGTQATISKSSGTVSSDYLNITDSAATGGATWNAGANSVDGGNNTGWTFGGASSQSLLPSLFVNVNIFHSASVTQTAPQQALLPGIYTNTNTFYLTSVTQTSSQQTLLPSLYVNTNTFYSANVSAAYLLAPAIYVNANAFYAPVVTAGPVLIAPALYGNTNTFYAATASASYTVSPDLLANTNIFYNPRVAQLQKLFPALVEPNNLFYAASVSAGPVNISPLLIANQNTFYSSKVFWWDTQPVASSDWDDFPISSKTWTELSVTEETWDVV